MKEEIVDNEELLDIVNEIEKQDGTIRDLKKGYPEENKKLEEVLLNYMGENDPKIFKTELLDKWKYLTNKRAYPYKNFNRIDDYEKPIDNLKKNISSVNLKMIILVMKKLTEEMKL